jgi:hypothetical protein
LETALVRSVRRDAPSPHARAAVLSALGIGAAVVPATTTVATAAGKVLGITALGLVKSAAIGAGTAAVVLAVVHQTFKPPLPAPSLPDPVAAVAVVVPAERPAPALSAAVTVEPEVSPRIDAKATPALRSQAPAEPVRGESPLSAEIAALDRARSAARRHDAVGALALLDAYEHEFPNGLLAVEADVVRIEALADSGQHDRALALGQALLRTSPSGPHAERVRSIVANIEAAPGGAGD